MKRLRLLGITVITALALSAIAGVASAGASGLVVAQHPATVFGEQTEPLTFHDSGFEYACNTPGLGNGNLNFKNERSPSVSLYASPYSCTSSSGKSTLNAEGCQFTFTPGILGAAGSLTTSGCTMVLHQEPPNCTWHFKPQTIATQAFVNEGSPNKVKVHLNGYMHYTEGSPILCGPTEGNLGVTGTWVLRAMEESGSYIGISVDNGDGVYFNSGASQFEAEAYPVNLGGVQTSTPVLTVNEIKYECSEALFASSISGASTLLSDSPGFPYYGGCTAKVAGLTKAVEIKTNGCSLGFHGAGTADVACKGESEAIEVRLFSTKKTEGTVTCFYKIKPQTGLTGVSYSTVGSGSSRGIGIALNLSALKLTNEQRSAVCGLNATETATYTGNTTLYAGL